VPVQEPTLNRRERKSLLTHRQIVRAASELVLEDGYERATIARIADRADLATRTVTSRFPSKETIFFEGVGDDIERAVRQLELQDGDPVDRLRAWIDGLIAHAEQHPADPEIRLLRSRAIASDPDLRAMLVQHFDRVSEAIARAAGAETGQSPYAVGPQMIAAAAVAMLGVLERLAAEDSEQTLLELERGLRLLRGAMGVLADVAAP
jgi:AcrR family transcriptional regulator